MTNPLLELLAMLRINPGTGGIKAIAEFVEEERGDYYNLGKAIRTIMARPLTEEEEAFVGKLGASAGAEG